MRSPAAAAASPDLPGTYKIDLDLAPALNSAMTQLGLAEEDLADLTLPVPYTLTLGEDGTYSMQADKEATVTALHTYLQGCGSAIEAALYKTAEESGLSREDFDAAFEQSTGSSVSDYVAEQISQLDEESLLSSLEEDEESGVYKAADGKLYFEEPGSRLLRRGLCFLHARGRQADLHVRHGATRWTCSLSARC